MLVDLNLSDLSASMSIKHRNIFCIQCNKICKDHGPAYRVYIAKVAKCHECNITTWYNDNEDNLYAMTSFYVEGCADEKLYSLTEFKRILNMKAFI